MGSEKRAKARKVFKPGRKQFDGLVDLYTGMYLSNWRCYSKYRCVGGRIYQDGDEWFPYVPLIEPDLFLSFARLGAHGEPSVSSIVRWVSGHGLLTLGGDGQRGYEDYAVAGLEPPSQDEVSVSEFRVHVSRAYDLLTLYTEIRSRDTDAIKARAAQPKSSLDTHLSKVFEVMVDRIKGEWVEKHGIEEDDADLYIAYSALAKHLTPLISDVQTIVGFDDLNSVVHTDEGFFFFGKPQAGEIPAASPMWRCPSLISAIYMQFCLLLMENKPMRLCENPACGMPFQVTRKDKRFCNNTCRSNARHYR